MAAEIILVFMLASSYGHVLHGLWRTPIPDHNILNERSNHGISNEHYGHWYWKRPILSLKAKNNQDRGFEPSKQWKRPILSLKAKNNQDREFEPSRHWLQSYNMPHQENFYERNHPDHFLYRPSNSESRSGNISISVNVVPINTTNGLLSNVSLPSYKSTNQSDNEPFTMDIHNRLIHGFANDGLGNMQRSVPIDITYGTKTGIPSRQHMLEHIHKQRHRQNKVKYRRAKTKGSYRPSYVKYNMYPYYPMYG